ncbi:MAG: molybdopterin-dependent oxidoreductase [Thermoanaerobaculia bacterium]
MILPRRDFLKMLGVAAGAATVGGCGREWAVPDRLVDLALRGPGLESQAQTICGLCEGGCGLTVRLVDGLPVGLKGNPHHPLNRGGLCPVGQAGLEVLYASGRLQGPLRRDPEGAYGSTTWESALGEIAGRLADLRAAGEGHRVALLSGESGQLFHELATRFVNAMGSPNIGHVLDAGVLPFTLTQGLDEIPGFDLEQADVVLSFGLDLYEDGPTPLHAISAMVGSRPIEERGTLLHVGSRLSPSATKAEIFVPIRPGSHGAFALGVAQVLVREGIYDRRFVAEHTFGFDDWTDETGRQRLGFRRLLLERYYPDRVAQLCGCGPERIVAVARRIAEASAPLAVTGGEATQGSNATSTAMAVHALNALLGAFDRPGGVVMPPPIPLSPLPPIEQPPSADGVSIFSANGGGSMLGVDPVAALTQRILDDSNPVEILVVVSANPVYSSPIGERLREALKRIPMVVVLGSFHDETAACADLILPTNVFLESWQGSTTPPAVAFSTLGLAPPVVEPLFDTRHPGDFLLELGRQAGPEAEAALPWRSYADYLKQRVEGLAISGQGSVITGTFEESWIHFLEARGWRILEKEGLEAFWKDLLRESGWWNPVRAQGDWARLFRTPTGRYEFFSRTLERGLAAGEFDVDGDEAYLPHYEAPRESGEGELALVPFRPLTARGQLGVTSPMVLEMFGYPVFSGWQTWVELAPETAHELDLEWGDLVEVESDRGVIAAVVRVQPGATPGTVHIPLGLGHREPFGAGGGVGANPVELLDPVPDQLAGTLALSSTRVRLRLLRRRPHGGPPPVLGGHEA